MSQCRMVRPSDPWRRVLGLLRYRTRVVSAGQADETASVKQTRAPSNLPIWTFNFLPVLRLNTNASRAGGTYAVQRERKRRSGKCAVYNVEKCADMAQTASTEPNKTSPSEKQVLTVEVLKASAISIILSWEHRYVWFETPA